jgi:hypothetical protein
VIELVRSRYADFGPSLAAEVLFEKDGVKVSRETRRRWMVEDGLWLSRKQRRSFHQPRLRREAYGELIQIDGSEHRWFEDRGAPCSLLVFIDDATGKLMQLRFVPSESMLSYFDCLRGYLEAHGCPVAFYSDKHTVFRMNRDAQGGQGMTQFGRALSCPQNESSSHGNNVGTWIARSYTYDATAYMPPGELQKCRATRPLLPLGERPPAR